MLTVGAKEEELIVGLCHFVEYISWTSLSGWTVNLRLRIK